MKKTDAKAVNLVEMRLDLLRPTDSQRVPFGVKFSVNAEAAQKYKETFGERWTVILEAYQNSIVLANKFFVQELTRLCREATDGEKEEKTKETQLS